MGGDEDRNPPMGNEGHRVDSVSGFHGLRTLQGMVQAVREQFPDKVQGQCRLVDILTG